MHWHLMLKGERCGTYADEFVARLAEALCPSTVRACACECEKGEAEVAADAVLRETGRICAEGGGK